MEQFNKKLVEITLKIEYAWFSETKGDLETEHEPAHYDFYIPSEEEIKEMVLQKIYEQKQYNG